MTGKGHKGDFLVLAGGCTGMKIVKIHVTEHLICIHLIVCKLYLNFKKGGGGRISTGNDRQVTLLKIVISI